MAKLRKVVRYQSVPGRPPMPVYDDQPASRAILPPRNPLAMLIKVPKRVNPKDVPALRRRIQEYVNAVLCDDGEGDYSWLLALMAYKIRRLRKAILKANIVQDAEKIAKQMQVVEEALERIDKDDYHYNRTQALHKKHNIKLGVFDRSLEYVPIDKSKPMDKKGYEKALKAELRKADAEVKADLRLAFDTMRDNIRTWWD